MAFTVAALESEIADLITARTAVLQGGASYQLNGKSITRANLTEVNRRLQEAYRQLDVLKIGNNGTILADFQSPYDTPTPYDVGRFRS